MATSGSFTTDNVGNIGSNYPRHATFNWWQDSQSVDGNYTNIGWNFVLGGGSSSRSTIGVYSGGVTVNGEWSGFNFGGSKKGNGTVLTSGSKTIYHNDDGSRSFSASGSVNLYWSSGHTVYGDGSWWLPTIARKVNISSVSGSYTDEDFSPLVKWTNNGNRVDLKIELPDLGINPFKRWENLQGSNSFKPTLTSAEIDELLQKLPSDNTTTVRFTITTVIGGEDKFFSYTDKTFSIVNAKPIFPYFLYEDTNSKTTAITGDNQVLIQNASTLVVKIYGDNRARPVKYASMISYSADCSGLSRTVDYDPNGNEISFGQLNATQNQTATISAVDSRGNKASVSRTVTVLPYSKPVINLSVARKNNFENETTIKISGKYSSISGKNTINATTGVQYRFKDSSTTNWSAWQNLTATFDNGDFTIAPFILNFDNSKSFNIEARVTDRLNTTTVAVWLDRGIPILLISANDSKCYNNGKRMLVEGDSVKDLSLGGNIIAGIIHCNHTRYTDSQCRDYAGRNGTVSWGQGELVEKVPTLVVGQSYIQIIVSNTGSKYYSLVRVSSNSGGGVGLDPIQPNPYWVSLNEDGFTAMVKEWGNFQYKTWSRIDATTNSSAWTEKLLPQLDFTWDTDIGGIYEISYHSEYTHLDGASQFDFLINIRSGAQALAGFDNVNTASAGMQRSVSRLFKATGTKVRTTGGIRSGLTNTSCQVYTGYATIKRFA